MKVFASLKRGVPPEKILEDLVPVLKQIVPQALDRFGTSILQYSTPNKADFLGFVPLKEQIAKSLNIENPGRIIIGNGGMSVISWLVKLLQSFRPGSTEIAVEAATYDRFLQLCAALGYQVAGVHFGDEGGINTDHLEKVLLNSDVGLFYQNGHDQNPTGKRQILENVKAGAEICRKNNCLYLFDAPYRELHMERHETYLLPLDEEPFSECCIFAGSFTKTIAPGLHCGYIVVPEWMLPLINPRVACEQLNPVYFTQGIIAEAMIQEIYQDLTRRIRRDYVTPRALTFNIATADFLSGANWTPLEGGYFGYIQFPGMDGPGAMIAETRSLGLEIDSGRGSIAPDCHDHILRLGEPFRFPVVTNEPEIIMKAIGVMAKAWKEVRS